MTRNRHLAKPTKRPQRTPITRDTPFVERIRLVLDISVKELAEITGSQAWEVKDACSIKRGTGLGEDDEFYETLVAYLNERIGRMIVARRDIQAKLHSDRVERLKRRERIRAL